MNRIAGILVRLAVLAAVLAAAWIYRGGIAEVGGALRTAGWLALLCVSAWHVFPLLLCALAWDRLSRPIPLPIVMLARWVRESVTDLAGFLPLAGEMAAGRLLAQRAASTSKAAALTVVDMTVEAVMQLVFCVVGVALWLARHPSDAVSRWALVGLGVGVLAMIALVLLQRSVVARFLETLPSRLLPKVWQTPDEETGVRAAIKALHTNRARLATAGVIHLAAWFAATGGAWIALRFLGHPLPVADVVALESLISALRSAAFVVPAALGVQEGGYLVLGAALGLSPETALALALLKRGRELVLGVPGLVVWQVLEPRQRPRTDP